MDKIPAQLLKYKTLQGLVYFWIPRDPDVLVLQDWLTEHSIRWDDLDDRYYPNGDDPTYNHTYRLWVEHYTGTHQLVAADLLSNFTRRFLYRVARAGYLPDVPRAPVTTTSHQALIRLSKTEEFLFVAFGGELSEWPQSVLEAYKYCSAYHRVCGLDSYRALFYLENLI